MSMSEMMECARVQALRHPRLTILTMYPSELFKCSCMYPLTHMTQCLCTALTRRPLNSRKASARQPPAAGVQRCSAIDLPTSGHSRVTASLSSPPHTAVSAAAAALTLSTSPSSPTPPVLRYSGETAHSDSCRLSRRRLRRLCFHCLHRWAIVVSRTRRG